MKQLHTFHEVYDSQKTFRLILEGMANPGRKLSLAETAGKLYGSSPEMLAAAMTLCDSSVSFCCVGDRELPEQIRLHTHSPQFPANEADFLFITDPSQIEAAFSQAKCGTLENPHASATLFIRDAGPETEKIRLSGPGINGSMECAVSETACRAVSLRDAQQYEYPQGVDLVLIKPDGTFFCVPRLVRKEG